MRGSDGVVFILANWLWISVVWLRCEIYGRRWNGNLIGTDAEWMDLALDRSFPSLDSPISVGLLGFLSSSESESGWAISLQTKQIVNIHATGRQWNRNLIRTDVEWMHLAFDRLFPSLDSPISVGLLAFLSSSESESGWAIGLQTKQIGNSRSSGRPLALLGHSSLGHFNPQPLESDKTGSL